MSLLCDVLEGVRQIKLQFGRARSSAKGRNLSQAIEERMPASTSRSPKPAIPLSADNGNFKPTPLSISCQSCVAVLCLFVRALSRRRSPRVIVDFLNRGVSVARMAGREDMTANRSRPEMAPQRFEKIESGPGNGMASDASKLQHLVRGRAADRALRLCHTLKSGSVWKPGRIGGLFWKWEFLLLPSFR